MGGWGYGHHGVGKISRKTRMEVMRPALEAALALPGGVSSLRRRQSDWHSSTVEKRLPLPRQPP